MIQEKFPNIVPKTPIITRPGEPETINTWELLAGPEDIMTPLLLSHRFPSFSFDVSRSIPGSPKMNLQQNGTLSLDNSKPTLYSSIAFLASVEVANDRKIIRIL